MYNFKKSFYFPTKLKVTHAWASHGQASSKLGFASLESALGEIQETPRSAVGVVEGQSQRCAPQKESLICQETPSTGLGQGPGEGEQEKKEPANSIWTR